MDDVTEQLERLIIDLVRDDMQQGFHWSYDSERLYDDEVAHLALPCVLCLAQHLAERFGFGSLGYDFALRNTDRPGFPIAVARREDSTPSFSYAEVFVRFVFVRDLRDCRHDLAELFHRAVEVIRPEWSCAQRMGPAHATSVAAAVH